MWSAVSRRPAASPGPSPAESRTSAAIGKTAPITTPAASSSAACDTSAAKAPADDARAAAASGQGSAAPKRAAAPSDRRRARSAPCRLPRLRSPSSFAARGASVAPIARPSMQGCREGPELAVESARLRLEGEEHDEPPAHPRGPDDRHGVGGGRGRAGPRRAVGGQQSGDDAERRQESQHHEQRRRDAARGGDERRPHVPPAARCRRARAWRNDTGRSSRLASTRAAASRSAASCGATAAGASSTGSRAGSKESDAMFSLVPSRGEHPGIERDRRRAPAADQDGIGPWRRARHAHGLLERAEDRAGESRGFAGDRERGGAHFDRDRALGPQACRNGRQELDRGEARTQERHRVPAGEEHEIERPADAALRDEAARVVVHDAHTRVAKRHPVGLREPLEQEGEGGGVRLHEGELFDGMLQQHRHETALHSPEKENAARPRHEQREEVAPARRAVRVGEAALVLPARVEVEYVVPPRARCW